VVGWTLDDPDQPAGYVLSEEQQLCRADGPEAGRASGAEFMGYQSAAETLADWLTELVPPDRPPLPRVELATGRQFTAYLAEPSTPFPLEDMLAFREASTDSRQDTYVLASAIVSVTVIDDQGEPPASPERQPVGGGLAFGAHHSHRSLCPRWRGCRTLHACHVASAPNRSEAATSNFI
jgi:hypothetical protein